MYPNLYYLIRDITGFEIPAAQYISTLGLFIVCSFLAGIYFLHKDLMIKESLGFYIYNNKTRVKKAFPGKIKPSKSMGDVILLAAISGIIGGKIFYCLENWAIFRTAPISILFSFSGINYYGSLLLSSVVIWFYYQYNNIKPIYIADSFAPALMIAYAIGRLGCHIAGDGDWGIVNKRQKPFAGLPDWIWGYTYPHNISRQGSIMHNCDWGNYCYQLAYPVFPTALYEFVICLLLFFLLWYLRYKVATPAILWPLYLIMVGAERFLIETIRINPQIQYLHMTQAQVISIILIVLGLVLISTRLIKPKWF